MTSPFSLVLKDSPIMLRTTLLLLAAFFYTSPALAAWGENWGEMVWGGGCAFRSSVDGWTRAEPARARLDRAGDLGAALSRDAWVDGSRVLRRRG